MTRPFIDLRRSLFRRQVQSLVVYGTWAGQTDEETEPCLAIVPLLQTTGRPAVICLSAAFLWDNVRYAARRSRELAMDLGLGDGMVAANNVAHAVIDNLADLVAMPPLPTEAVVGAEVLVMVNGGKPKEITIVDHDPARVD